MFRAFIPPFHHSLVFVVGCLALYAPHGASAVTLNVPASYATIQAAINVSNAGDTVLVADGTYTGAGNTNLDFGGKNIIVTSVNGAANTTIDCQGNSSSNSRAFTFHSGETLLARVDGFTIKNGYAANGGAMNLVGSSPAIINCIFMGNTATNGGGAIYMSGCSPFIDSCSFTTNAVTASGGGGIYANLGSPSITNCIFHGNSAPTLDGAGIHGDNSNLTVAHCTFTDIDNGSIYPNDGGGIFASGATVTVTGCMFDGLRAVEGSGIYAATDTITVTNCVFIHGAASNVGSGIEFEGSGSVSTVMNCTFGDTIYYRNGSGVITNSIFYDDDFDALVFGTPVSLSVTYSDVKFGLSGTGNIDADPLWVNSSIDDYHLQAASPCAGKGTHTGAPATDAAGNVRPNPPSMGAYEVGVNAPFAPSSIIAAAGNAQVLLSWSASIGATSYNVKRSTTSGGPYTVISSPTTTSFTNTGLIIGTTYYYVVSAVNSGGESANSSQVSATPFVVIPPAPSGLAATSGNAQVTLTWTPSTGATSYNIKRSTTIGGPYTTVAGAPAASYTNTGLTNGVTYYFVVSAINAGGESGNSAQVSAKPFVTTVGSPVIDFNSDGKADLILRNGTTNQVAFWYMNAATVLGGAYVSTTPPSGWNVASTGDFNGDGKPDLVLQNATTSQIALWNLNGAALTGGAYIAATPTTGWQVAGSSDFNGDGKRDLVLQNMSTHQAQIWYLNGTNVTGVASISSALPFPWQVVAVGDFNGDGKPDLALQNTITRQIALWYLNGATLTSGGYVSSIPGTGWTVAGAGEFNGDGELDLVLQNATSNKIALWYLNGVTLLGGAYTSTTPVSAWKVVGPR